MVRLCGPYDRTSYRPVLVLRKFYGTVKSGYGAVDIATVKVRSGPMVIKISTVRSVRYGTVRMLHTVRYGILHMVRYGNVTHCTARHGTALSETCRGSPRSGYG